VEGGVSQIAKEIGLNGPALGLQNTLGRPGALPLEAYVSESKRPIRIGGEMGANSRVLQLASIARSERSAGCR
jgi:hypothetical protein